MGTPCTRCGTTVVLSKGGTWVTGDGKGWILPSQYNNTCDGMRLHTIKMMITMSATYDTTLWEGEDEEPIEGGGFTDPTNPWGGFRVELPAHENRTPQWYTENVTTVSFDDIAEAAQFVVDFPGAVWDYCEGEAEQDYRTGEYTSVTLHVREHAAAVFAAARELQAAEDAALARRAG
jgi:hypothetical protein